MKKLHLRIQQVNQCRLFLAEFFVFFGRIFDNGSFRCQTNIYFKKNIFVKKNWIKT